MNNIVLFCCIVSVLAMANMVVFAWKISKLELKIDIINQLLDEYYNGD